MEMNKNNAGSVVISEEVISKIAKVAATDVEGVAGIVPRTLDIKSMLRSKKVTQGVHVLVKDNQFTIDIFLKIKVGYKVAEVAQKVQQSIKEAVQNMTGTLVYKVNVHISEVELTINKEN